MEPLRTLQKKRTSNFREDETRLLIQLWGSPQIQNKLYLTHRKSPVMRLLAANMQHRGFYRTPDEIKTRIRNLKCLYYRIKRSMKTGTGLGTVDPDWPHFKAMDEVLTKRDQGQRFTYKDNVFEGPRCEDIKQEVNDEIDINDDMESFTTNSHNGSDAEFEDEGRHQLPTLTPAPNLIEKVEKDEPEPVRIAPRPQLVPQPKIIPNNPVQIPLQTGIRAGNPSAPTIPFPLLILNGLPNGHLNQNQLQSQNNCKNGSATSDSDVSGLLKTLLEIHKDNLEVEKQRLELDKQKLEFERLIGGQFLTLLPMFGTLLHRQFYSSNTDGNSNEKDRSNKKNSRKRASPEDGLDIFKDSKILRNVLEQGIKKYMMEESEKDDVSEDEDKVQNDDSNNSIK